MHDSAPTPVSAAAGWRRRALAVVLACVAAGYALVLAGHVSSAAGGADSSGYLNSARLLARGNFLAPVRMIPGFSATEFGEMAFQPLGFRLQPKGDRMAPTYPIGLPFHLLVAAKLAGWHNAALLVNVLTMIACGVLMLALARRLGLAPVFAGAGVTLLWFCPLFFFSALQPMSDLLALGWSLAVMYCALRACDHWRWGLACGLALGVAVLVRPTNALLVVPVLVALGFNWRYYLAVALGGLPGALALTYYNRTVYGSPFTTGYGNVSSAFSPSFLAHNLAHFAQWIPALLSPFVLAALAAPFVPALRHRGFAVLGVWWLTLTGFYAFYYHSGETWWYLRFILPGFPSLLLAALAVVAASLPAVRLRSQTAALAGGTVLLLSLGWQLWQIRQLNILPYASNEQTYPDAARWAKQNLPSNSAICCMQVSGAFYYYSDFLLVRWDEIATGKSRALSAAIAGEKRPLYAALFPFETPEALEKLGGQWTKLATVGQVTFWQRQP